MTEKTETFEGWAILELMGHRRLAGFVREQEIAGAGMLRIDVPGEGEEVHATQFYPPSSLYCLTPVTEDMARAIAARNRPEPVQRWELPVAREPERRNEFEEEPFDEDDEGFPDEEPDWAS
jgi:hypothetical protein